MVGKYKGIVIHCSADVEGSGKGVQDIRKSHLSRGWRDIGYHFVITEDGEIHEGRPINETGAHVKGFNEGMIGICYIGGLDKNKKPKDTRTSKQKHAMAALVSMLLYSYGNMPVKGHRDFSKDLDGDGIIERHEWMKACPCFNVGDWMEEIGLS